MRAAVFDSYGPPEVLRVGDVAVPSPRPGEVLVKVYATSANGGDIAARSGTLRLLTGSSFPKRTGVEFTGEVAATADLTAPWSVGDRVWGVLPRSQYARGGGGSAAEYVAVPISKISELPATVDPVEAAGLLAGGTTGLKGLRDVAGLRRGERLLVTGANGGVGSVAVQLGKALGAHVTGYGNAAARERLTVLGADEFVDHRVVPPSALGAFDVVFDTTGTRLEELRRLLSPGGRMVSIAARGGRPIAQLVASQARGPRRIRFFSGDPGSAALGDLARFVERGQIVPVTAAVHDLDAIADAHRALEGRGVVGKHIVQVSPPAPAGRA